MPKRKHDLASKLSNTQTPGWKEQITPAKTKSASYIRKTYLVTPELIERIKSTSIREQVGQNELVRYLLTWALDRLDEGDHNLPVEVEQVYRIKE